MDRPTAEAAIKIYLKEIRERLEECAKTAKVAECSAEAGNIDQAVRLSLDIEQPCYEASRLLDAASLLNRLSQE